MFVRLHGIYMAFSLIMLLILVFHARLEVVSAPLEADKAELGWEKWTGASKARAPPTPGYRPPRGGLGLTLFAGSKEAPTPGLRIFPAATQLLHRLPTGKQGLITADASRTCRISNLTRYSAHIYIYVYMVWYV